MLFAVRLDLFVARALVIVEHGLVAEHIEDEVEQRLRRQLAELVGRTLFEGENAADRLRQAGAFETYAVFAQAEEVVARFDLFDADVAADDGVLPRPLTAFLLDAAGERDFAVHQREERALAARAGNIA